MTSLQITTTEIDKGSDKYLVEASTELQPNLLPADTRDRIHYQGFYPGDITMPGVVNGILDFSRKFKPYADIIVGDADIPNGQAELLKIVQSYLLIYERISNQCTVIIIRFQSFSSRFPLEILLLFKCLLKHFHIVPEGTSAPHRNEWIVILSQNQTGSPSTFIDPANPRLCSQNLPIAWYQDTVVQFKRLLLGKISAFFPSLKVALQHQISHPMKGSWSSLKFSS